jgi:hypothetical protein
MNSIKHKWEIDIPFAGRAFELMLEVSEVKYQIVGDSIVWTSAVVEVIEYDGKCFWKETVVPEDLDLGRVDQDAKLHDIIEEIAFEIAEEKGE